MKKSRFRLKIKIKIAKNWTNSASIISKAAGPGPMSKRQEFFETAKKVDLKHAKLTAFGATHRYGISAKDDKA
ncbi:MAG: hypothetical protein R2875_16205 [Desulfobacterales bacterium]